MPAYFPINVSASRDVQVTIHLHEIFLGDRPRLCWTYLTDGLTELGQQEMALSLLLEDDDSETDFPQTPIRIFRLLADHAQQGKVVVAGQVTKLGKTGLFGYQVLYYLPAIQFEQLPSLDDHLALILVHQQEYDFVRQYGLARLISRMAKLCSCLPYPTWNTRQRPSLFEADHRELTLLGEGFGGRAPIGVLVNEHGLVLDRAQLRSLLVYLRDHNSAIVPCSPCRDADAAVHWHPERDQQGVIALEHAPSRICISFVHLVVGDTSYLGFQEDGALLSLTRADLATLDGQNDAASFIKVGSEESVLSVDYRFGAAWIHPPLLRQIHLNERSGNTLLTRIELSAPFVDEHVQIVTLATEVQHALASAMSEEADSLLLKITLTSDQVSASANIELNPDFVGFLHATLQAVDRHILSDRSATLSLSINP